MLDELLAEAANTKDGHKPVVSLRDVGIALFQSAAGGNAQAMALLADRLDGKVPQQLHGTDQEGEASPFVVYVGSTVEADLHPKRLLAKNTKATEVLYRGASGSGGPPGERNGQYRHGERTKAAIAEQQKFSALLKMLRAGLR